MSYKIDTTTVQPIVIPDVSSTSDGVMTPEMLAELDGLVEGSTLEIYVSPSGNDNNPGTQAQPVKTIEQAFNLITTCNNINAIHFSPGNYTFQDPFQELHFVSSKFPKAVTEVQLLGSLTNEVGTVTVTAASPTGVFLNASGLALTNNQYEGAVVTITGSAGQSTTTTDNPLTAGATTINVVSTTGFPSAGTGDNGFLIIGSEKIIYAAKTGTSFTGCTRGAYGTVATAHTIGSAVTSNANLNAQGIIKESSANLSTTVSDNPLSNSATTINVASTAGFSTSGTLLIQSEVILYTNTTGTSFTGCTRGAYGTSAAAHNLGTSVTSNTIEVLVPFAAAISVGDTFTIGKPAVNINFNSLLLTSSGFTIKNIKFTCDPSLYPSPPPSISLPQLRIGVGCFTTMTGCEIDLKNNLLAVLFAGTFATAAQSLNQSMLSNPILTTQEPSAVYIHDGTLRSLFDGHIFGAFVLRNVLIQAISKAFCNFTALDAKNSQATASQESWFSIGSVALGAGVAGSHTNRMSVMKTPSATGALIASSDPCTMDITNTQLIGSAGSGLLVANRGTAKCSGVIGSNNTVVGIAVATGSRAQIDATTVVTGTTGDTKVGSNVLTYASISASKGFADDQLNQIDPANAVTTSRLVAESQINTVANITGSNGPGAVTATGAKVGDKVLAVSFAAVPTAVAGTQAGLTAFESVITVAGQIQQTGAANLSSEKFDLLLLTP